MPEISPGLDFSWRFGAAEALQARHEFILPAHLFMGLCLLDLRPVSLGLREDSSAKLEPEGDALRAIFTRFGIDSVELFGQLKQQIGEGKFSGLERTQVSRSPASKAAFTRAADLATNSGLVTAFHLLAALIDETDAPAVTLLQEKTVDLAALKSAALEASSVAVRAQAAPLLTRFGKDLTALAHNGKLRECIGRRDEMLRIVQTLHRDTKNNPLLLGEAGVGKTAIVEGLAYRIVQGKTLPGKRIVQINLADLVADTKYRGEFEERLQTIVREVTQSPDTIVFIDEIHTLIRAGDVSGGLDAANILKPALARGELRLIGATTLDEYRRSLEKDSALNRRFQPITIHEPTEHETQEVLVQGYCKRFEQRHHVVIELAAVEAAVELSTRYLPDRRLPDKAIDLLDEACARVSVPVLTIRPGGAQPQGGLVTAEAVARVLSEWMGIPLGQLSGDERDRLSRMAEELKRRVIGQDVACEAIAQAVQRARVGLRTAGRPVGVFLFIGPTGVGKTELAKATASFLFGSERALVRIDMSEYQERHSTSRLIGAPPGYVGHEAEGQLTGAIRRTPFCVVLLDEIEKAHPDVLNLFLQLFDDGRLTDGHGRTVDASNALFIMTSNIGHGRSLGFAVEDSAEHLEALLTEVRKSFRPEFLNRIDDRMVFRSLSREDAARIVRLLLSGLAERLKAQGVFRLDVRDAAIELLTQEGYNDTFGARELRRVVERLVEDPIAGKLLREELRPGHMILLDAHAGRVTFELVGGVTL